MRLLRVKPADKLVAVRSKQVNLRDVPRSPQERIYCHRWRYLKFYTDFGVRAPTLPSRRSRLRDRSRVVWVRVQRTVNITKETYGAYAP